jgi:hypothetical protein
MAHIIQPLTSSPSGYRGLGWIFEYTNFDGALSRYNCGQAAAASFLTHHGFMDPLRADRNMAWLERYHPPDQLAGWFGTGRHRVERILRTFHLEWTEVVGESALRHELDAGNPVILMIGISSCRRFGFDMPGGHWMLAYGYDSERVHLTNWGTMSWDELHRGWHTLTTRWIRMNGRGLTRRIAVQAA